MKSLKGKFILLFIVLIMVSALGFLFIWSTVSSVKADGVVINMAGRQRMLTQKFTKEFFNEIIQRQMRYSSLKAAKIATTQIKEDRAKYTRDVVGKLKKELSGIKPLRNWADVKGGIPLPATFVQEVSKKINERGEYRYDLMSKWNINREKGLNTPFEEDAFEFISKDKEKPYFKYLEYNGRFVLRYATADIASSKACVNCHNALPESKKQNFKLGDLMGILIVTIPITHEVTIGKGLFAEHKGTGGNHGACNITKMVFEKSMEALLKGGEVPIDLAMTKFIKISPENTREIESQLEKVNGIWQGLQEKVHKIRTSEVNSPEYLTAFVNLQKINLEVLKNMNRAVKMYEIEYNKKMGRLKMVQIVVLIVTIGAIILGWLFFVNPLVKLLENLITRMRKSGDRVANASRQISSSSQQTAEGASEQASTIEETSSSMEEMSSMIRQNADHASEASQLSSKAMNTAEDGSKSVNNMIAAMKDINSSSDKISNIIKVIDEIAFQTNLLALNAAVEAARAGEHGKGFAVVAEEVRNLAQRSSAAAKDTAALIEENANKARDGSKLADRSGDVLKEIVEHINKMTGLLGEIASASKEQSTGVDQVNTAVSQIDKVTQQNASNAEQLASGSEELSSQAIELQGIVDRLASEILGVEKK